MIMSPVGDTGQPGFLGIRRRRALTFTIGAVVSAATMGALLAMLGRVNAIVSGVTSTPGLITICIIEAVYIAADVADIRLPVPTSTWQVPRSWVHHGEATFAFLFGLSLGAGFLTVVPFVGFYSLLISIALVQPPSLAIATMLVYGVVRSAPLIAVANSLRVNLSVRTSLGVFIRNSRDADDVALRWARICGLAMLPIAIWLTRR